MFRKKPVLQYESAIDVYPNIVTPAKNHIPQWYKDIPRWKNNEILDSQTRTFNITVKQCMPGLDSLMSGYMIVLPIDLYVKNENGIPLVTWNVADFPPSSRDVVANLNLVPAGHYPLEFVWKIGAAITVPLGYSILFTHPLNRYDLPFTTLTGIVNGGFVSYPDGKIPFFIKKEFEGIIPKGTPIIQLIPFCQENWSSKIKKGLVKMSDIHNKKSGSLISGWYKQTFWTRKKYD